EHGLTRALAPLAEVLAREGEVRPALLHDAERHRVVDEVGRGVDAGSPADVELRLLERGSTLVLHDLHTRARADSFLAHLHGTRAPHVEAHARVELERVAA